MATRRLAIMIENRIAAFPRTVIVGTRRIAEQHGYELVEMLYVPDPHDPTKITFDLSQFAGILVIANAIPNPVLQSIYQTGKPVSLVCHQIPGLHIPTLMSANFAGMTELVRHMVVRCGRRHLVFIRGLMNQTDGQQREVAFRQELIRHKLHVPESHILQGDFSECVATDSVRQFVEGGERFDAIVAADYLMANAAIAVLRASGIAVPEDVSVVGFGDGPESEEMQLTTVAADVAELGSCAAKQLISQINGLPISGTTELGVKLMVRQTCGYRLSSQSN